MGYASRPDNVMKCLGAFAEVLGSCGFSAAGGDAEAAARAVLGSG